MIDTGDLRKGLTFDLDGRLVKVVDFQHNKQGRGRRLRDHLEPEDVEGPGRISTQDDGEFHLLAGKGSDVPVGDTVVHIDLPDKFIVGITADATPYRIGQQ